MQQSVDEISTKDIDEIIDAAPVTTNIGGMVPLRQDTKAELDKLLDKEYVNLSPLHSGWHLLYLARYNHASTDNFTLRHVMIEKLRGKLSAIEISYKEFQ